MCLKNIGATNVISPCAFLNRNISVFAFNG